ncbi:hypothetical protein FDECE_18575 [Fusarium decemcellulare]|nr:hypothetical protein FDECE_18575 [Fusarium decemcellulare]
MSPRPQLRDTLTTKLSEYEPNSLCLELVQNFELEKNEDVLKQPIFVLNPDTSDIMLNTGMRDVVYNPTNFQMRQGFKRKYPDLQLCFAIENSQDERSTCRDGFVARAHPSGTAIMRDPSISMHHDDQPQIICQVDSSNTNQTVAPIRHVGCGTQPQPLEGLLDTLRMNFMETSQDFEPLLPYELTGPVENTVDRIRGDVLPDRNTTKPFWPEATGNPASAAAVDLCPDRVWGTGDVEHEVFPGTGQDLTTPSYNNFM